MRKKTRDTGYRPVRSAFLDLNFCTPSGVFGACPSEMLHLMYLGAVTDTVELSLLSVENLHDEDSFDEAVWEMNRRLKEMPRFRHGDEHVRRFTTGMGGVDFNHMTGEDYVHLLSQLLFVFGEQNSIFPNTHEGQQVRRRVMEAVQIVYSIVYEMITCRAWGEQSNLLALDSGLVHCNRKMKAAFQHLSGSSMKKPKVHALCHVCTSIREFGGPQHYNSGMYESNHVLDVKGLLDRVSGSGGDSIPAQLLAMVRIILLRPLNFADHSTQSKRVRNALHVDALMKSNPTTLANGSGAPSTCSGSRQLAGDDDTLSLCTQSTASSASSTFTVCERGGVSFRLAPAAGIMGLHSAPVSEDERAPFLRKLAHFACRSDDCASSVHRLVHATLSKLPPLLAPPMRFQTLTSALTALRSKKR